MQNPRSKPTPLARLKANPRFREAGLTGDGFIIVGAREAHQVADADATPSEADDR